MSEIVNKKYIKDNNVLESKYFDKQIIKDGKSIYEVIRVIDGVPLFLGNHLKRLNNSFDMCGIKVWLSHDEIKRKLLNLIQINDTYIGNIKIVFNINNDERCFLAYFIKHKYPDYNDYKNGVKAILYHEERCNPNIKMENQHFRDNVNKKIKKHNAHEAILVDRNGNITEGSRSNIFMVNNNKIITPPVEDVLPGVTRGMIIDICKQNNFKVEQERIHYKNLKYMDAIFMSGTSPGVLPICSVDEQIFLSSTNYNVLNITQNYNDTVDQYINRNRN